ncbi:Satratoxin biosynthesis SC1 cluster protein 4 [Golovinomyces cichoracearum]|uniref:Satratoxin biosynthesis SC1 cluster protein 4 n=1 Tax=Golovinomyces cichoracearum TaxID=62708 RepID=A0A420IIX1_9PEZI|nr:Satratoxin biosynthesis SC1 cluster protein 4 [Golovinomyces cichoracearum]
MDSISDPRLAAFIALQAEISAKQNLSQDIRQKTRLICCTSAGISLVFIVLRFWARFRRAFGYGNDDWMIAVSFIFLLGNLGCVLALIENGVGLHSGALTLSNVTAIAKILVLNECLYVTNINLIKLSVLAMYYRFFPLRQMRKYGLIIAWISITWNLSLILLALLQCTPFKKTYEPWVEGRCIDLKATFLGISVPSIMTDIAILSLPLPHVWKLQTKIWQKISLTAIFMLGSFVVFASIFRFIIYMRYEPNDFSYTVAPGLSWNTIELSSGIVSACLPTLGPFMRKFFKKIGLSTSSGANTQTKSGSRIEEANSRNYHTTSSENINSKEVAHS